MKFDIFQQFMSAQVQQTSRLLIIIALVALLSACAVPAPSGDGAASDMGAAAEPATVPESTDEEPTDEATNDESVDEEPTDDEIDAEVATDEAAADDDEADSDESAEEEPADGEADAEEATDEPADGDEADSDESAEEEPADDKTAAEEATDEPAADDEADSENSAEEDAAAEETAAETEEPAAEPESTDGEPTDDETDAGSTDEATTYRGLEIGFTEDGWAYRGDPNAPVTMYEYSDLLCPFCQRYVVQTEPAINDDYVKSGQVKIVFRDMPLAQLHPTAHVGHEASLCAGDQGALAYWQMHDQLFATATQWGKEADPQAVMVEMAEALGLDVDAFSECLDDAQKSSQIETTLAEAQSLGLTGTPSFIVVNHESGYEHKIVGAQPYGVFAQALDTLIAGEAMPEPAAEEGGNEGSGEIPFWATAEGLAPDPDHPGYNIAGDQYRGNTDAAVVVIEFSDFQCPFCQRHSANTQPVLDEQFVDTGDILWVFKHFPLDIHAQAPAAGVAAECAAEQGSFWEMQTLLFDNMRKWSISDPNPLFIDFSAQLDLDEAEFENCLNDDEIMARVQSDLQEGAQFVRGTPSFIVMSGDQGSIIPGALPLERFQEVLQEVLDGVQ